MAEKLKTRVNSKKLGEAWGMSHQMIYRLVQMGIIPKPEDGGWDWPDINIAYIETLKKRPAATTALTDERARRERIRADRDQLALDRERGDLIKTDLAQRSWSAVMQNISNRLDAIPSKIAPLAHGLPIPEIKDLADRLIYEVKNEIANPNLSEIARMAGHKRNPAPRAAKAPAKRKRVGGPKADAKLRVKRGTWKVVHDKG